MIRLLLVDDHASFRQSLALAFRFESDFTLAAQAGSLAEARTKLGGVDVAILDIELPDGKGIELIRELRQLNPTCMVLMLTSSTSDRDLAAAVEAGAAGFIHKTAPLDEIMGAARRLGTGEPLFAPREVIEMLRLASQHREQDYKAQIALGRLTEREREVLQALVDGLNDREIAQRLQISVETARNHMARIISKLGVESRLQALLFAVRHGAVQIR